MKAVVLEKSQVFSVKEVPDPVVESTPNWPVEYTGLCKTDSHLAKHPRKQKVILGHEVVVSDPHNPNDLYCLNNEIPCGECDYCKDQLHRHCQNLKELGVNMDGGYASILQTSKNTLFPIKVGDGAVATLAEPLSCAIHAVNRLETAIQMILPDLKKANVLIVGAGVSGKLLAYLLKTNQYVESVSVNDIDTQALAWVDQLGIHSVSEIAEKRYHLVIECSGSEGGLSTAFKAVRRGGAVCIYGMQSPNTQLPIDSLSLFEKELTVMSSMAGCTAATMSQAIQLIESNQLFFSSLIGKQIELCQVPDELLNPAPVPGTRTVAKVGRNGSS